MPARNFRNVVKVQCRGSYDKLIPTFKDEHITIVQVTNLPNNLKWLKACRTYIGMRETQQFRTMCWHNFDTPEQACNFMMRTNGMTFKGRKLAANGIYAPNAGFEEIMEGTRKFLAHNGIFVRERKIASVFTMQKSRVM